MYFHPDFFNVIQGLVTVVSMIIIISLSDFRQLLKTALFQTVPVYLVTERAFVAVNLLTERSEMSVYYYYYYYYY